MIASDFLNKKERSLTEIWSNPLQTVYIVAQLLGQILKRQWQQQV